MTSALLQKIFNFCYSVLGFKPARLAQFNVHYTAEVMVINIKANC